MKNILFLSIATGGYNKLFESCIHTHIDYCNKNGYHYTLIDNVPRPLTGAESSWIKLPLIKMALNKGYDWVAFIDADCDINPSMPLIEEYFEQLDSTKSIFLAKGKSGRINAGVIFAKNTPHAHQFLEKIIKNADNEVPVVEDRAPYENGHVIHYGKFNPNVYILEHKLWNNNSEIDTNCYIQHYSSGVLRDWYMQNRQETSPAKKPQDNLLSRGVKKLWKVLTFSGSQPKISKSIKELEPYFKANYNDFK